MLLTKRLRTQLLFIHQYRSKREQVRAQNTYSLALCHYAVLGSTQNNSGNRLRWTSSDPKWTNDDEILFIRRITVTNFFAPLPSCRHNAQCHCHYIECTSEADNGRNTTQEIMHRKLWTFEADWKKTWNSHRIFTFDKNQQANAQRYIKELETYFFPASMDWIECLYGYNAISNDSKSAYAGFHGESTSREQCDYRRSESMLSAAQYACALWPRLRFEKIL